MTIPVPPVRMHIRYDDVRTIILVLSPAGQLIDTVCFHPSDSPDTIHAFLNAQQAQGRTAMMFERTL